MPKANSSEHFDMVRKITRQTKQDAFQMRLDKVPLVRPAKICIHPSIHPSTQPAKKEYLMRYDFVLWLNLKWNTAYIRWKIMNLLNYTELLGPYECWIGLGMSHYDECKQNKFNVAYTNVEWQKPIQKMYECMAQAKKTPKHLMWYCSRMQRNQNTDVTSIVDLKAVCMCSHRLVCGIVM